MKIVKHDRFRTKGGVSEHTNMVRVVLDMTNREFCYLRDRIETEGLIESAQSKSSLVQRTTAPGQNGLKDVF